MIQTFTRELALLEYGVTSITASNQSETGDRHLVKAFPGGVLLAAVDGSGHGPEAAVVARMAVGILEAYANDDPIFLVRRCHEQLKTTRGVVLGLAVINGIRNTITWLGVGNIEGTLLRSQPSSGLPLETMLTRAGLVGHRLPNLQAVVSPVSPGDLIILTTDGIRPDFGRRFTLRDRPRAIAERISALSGTGRDDGLVLVARYQGPHE